MNELHNKLKAFVSDVCSNRDESHGVSHMEQVAKLTDQLILNTEDISDFMGQHPDEVRTFAKIVAWLHDVDDRKYRDHTMQTQRRIIEFLAELDYNNEVIEDILLTIKYVSYSEQLKLYGYEKPDWKILPDYMIPVRNFVSDADKIEALGIIGVHRCLGYSRHKHPDEDELFHVGHLINHYDEKLSKLASKFMNCQIAKEIAAVQHEIMHDEIEKLKNKYGI